MEMGPHVEITKLDAEVLSSGILITAISDANPVHLAFPAYRIFGEVSSGCPKEPGLTSGRTPDHPAESRARILSGSAMQACDLSLLPADNLAQEESRWW